MTRNPIPSAPTASRDQTTLWLVRHARVASHQGDQPLTDDALGPVDETAARIMKESGPARSISFHSTRTMRCQQTADALRDRIAPGVPDASPIWALRNPDLYLFGTRVEMVSTAEAFAAQIAPLGDHDLGPDEVLGQGFFKDFLTASDRIEYWLNHQSPPGETAEEVSRRVEHFARSLSQLPIMGHHAVCVTHSPVLRAVLTAWLGLPDPGEPGWVEPVALTLTDGELVGQFRAETVTRKLDG